MTRGRRPRSGRLALALASGLLAAACGAPDRARADDSGAAAGLATVVRVVDGDTLMAGFANGEERVRLIGIDTPETKKPDTPVECFGIEASEHLRQLLPEGASVRLERDVDERDRYGRLLAYVYRESDGLFVNEAMVADGFAAAYTVPPNVAHREAFTAAAASARTRGLGLWSRCGGTHQPAAR